MAFNVSSTVGQCPAVNSPFVAVHQTMPILQFIYSKYPSLQEFNTQLYLVSLLNLSHIIILSIRWLYAFLTKKPVAIKQPPSTSSLPDSTCEICTDLKNKFEFFAIEGCSHAYCKTCISRYISYKVENNVLLIKCPFPDCRTGRLEPGACAPVLEDGVFQRWCDALCESAVEDKFYCPYMDCSALVIKEGVVNEADCPHCNRVFCADCMVPWHVGRSCSEFRAEFGSSSTKEDLMLVKLAKEQLWKRCPNCKIFVEKTKGCVFVSCRCGITFCYKCGKRTKLHICTSCRIF